MKRRSIFIYVLGSFVGQAAGESQHLPHDKRDEMKRQVIRTPGAPTSPLYSQAILLGSTVYVTGVLGVDPKTKQVAGPTIQEQVRQSLRNCENILRAAGTTLENVVEVQVLLARPSDWDGLNEEYAKFFPVDPPIRSVTRLGPELPNILVSIKMMATL